MTMNLKILKVDKEEMLIFKKWFDINKHGEALLWRFNPDWDYYKLLEYDNCRIGMFRYTFKDETEVGINSLMIAGIYTGMGYCREMFDLLKFMHDNIYLYCTDRNLGLYKKLGFKEYESNNKMYHYMKWSVDDE